MEEKGVTGWMASWGEGKRQRRWEGGGEEVGSGRVGGVRVGGEGEGIGGSVGRR
jgi:hypothetical protein